MNKIIINADDFGLNESRTRAIYDAYQQGLITDTTIVANGDAFDLALDIINKDIEFSKRIGIHFNLTECAPLTDEMKRYSRFTDNGTFNRFFIENNSSFIHLSRHEKEIIYNELTAQIVKVKNAGIEVSHADSHHHVHMGLMLMSIFKKVCKENDIVKIRRRHNVKSMPVIRKMYYAIFNIYLKTNGFRIANFFGDAKDYLSVKDGVCEAMVHPDYLNGELVDALSKNKLRVHESEVIRNKKNYITYRAF